MRAQGVGNPTRAEIAASLCGFCFEQDRLWKITLPDGTVGYVADYNDEMTGYSPALGAADPLHFCYGGNAYYVTGFLAQERGWRVEEVPW